MEEKRICSNCGARLRPGARFCSECGAIVRNNPKPIEEVKITPENVEQKNVVETPTNENVIKEVKQTETTVKPVEYEYFEKDKKKEKETKIKKEKTSWEFKFSNKFVQQLLVLATSFIAVILGIILVNSNLIKVVYDSKYVLTLTMGDCFDVMSDNNLPVIFDIVNGLTKVCTFAGILSIIYLLVAIGYFIYNVVMFGSYNKLTLLVNMLVSLSLTLMSFAFIVLYINVKGKCQAVGDMSGYSTYIIILVIFSILMLAFDAVKATVLYQKELEEEKNPSYVIEFIKGLTKESWKKISVIGGSAIGVILIVIVIIACAKNPAIKTWDKYVNAFNDRDAEALADCCYSSDYASYDELKTSLEAAFETTQDIGRIKKGKAQVVINTKNYVKLTVKNVKYSVAGKDDVYNTIEIHLGKVDGNWYLMSGVDPTKGNEFKVDDFNQTISSSILEIENNVVNRCISKLTVEELKGLRKLVIPEGVTRIKSNAFKDYDSLIEIVLPNSLVSIDEGAFSGCTLLTKVIMGDKVTTIEKDAFKDCVNAAIYTKLTSVPEKFIVSWNVDKFYLANEWTQNVNNPERYPVLTIAGNGGETAAVNQIYAPGTVVALPEISKIGCVFEGWYTTPDFQESSKLISNVTISEDVTIYAKWKGNKYTITYNLDGGTLANMQKEYATGDVIVLGKPEKIGYTFIGWQGTGLTETTENVTIEDTTGDLSYKAIYTPNKYTITFNANGGTGSESLVVTYGDSIKVQTTKTFECRGMKLVGWNTTPDGSGNNFALGQNLTYVLPDNLTLYAVWSSLVKLDANGGKVVSVSPKIVYGSKYTLEVPTTTDYVFFDGWYLGEQKLTNDKGESITVWAIEEVVTLTAKWVERKIVNGINYCYQGEYPQTRVTDEELLTTLITQFKDKEPDGRGYYSYRGEKYASYTYDNHNSTQKFNDGTPIVDGQTYFFKVEKILWRIVDETTQLAVSDLIIDTRAFNNTNETIIEGEDTIFPNYYSSSDIEKWLNCGVGYQTKGFPISAFNGEIASFALFANISGYRGYALLLSQSEMINNYFKTPASRQCKATDYAIVKDLTINTINGCATWWSRDAVVADPKQALIVTSSGEFKGNLVVDETIGVRPTFYYKAK